MSRVIGGPSITLLEEIRVPSIRDDYAFELVDKLGRGFAACLDNTFFDPFSTDSLDVPRLVEDSVRFGTQICVNADRLDEVVEILGSNFGDLGLRGIPKPRVSVMASSCFGTLMGEPRSKETMDYLGRGASCVETTGNLRLMLGGNIRQQGKRALDPYLDDLCCVLNDVASFRDRIGSDVSLSVVGNLLALPPQRWEEYTFIWARGLAEMARERSTSVYLQNVAILGYVANGMRVMPRDQVALMRAGAGQYSADNQVGLKVVGGVTCVDDVLDAMLVSGLVRKRGTEIDLTVKPEEAYKVIRVGVRNAGRIVEEYTERQNQVANAVMKRASE
jgi:hypothetical protein